MKKISNYGKSVRAKLLNAAMSGDINYQMLLIRYIQERLLYRLSLSKYREHFVLKGGALLYAIQELEARPTLDLDFMGRNINREEETLLKAFREIAAINCPEDAVRFETDSMTATRITVNRQYHGIRIQLRAQLDTIRQSITLDIGFGDVITPNAQELNYPSAISGIPQATILAYSLESVLAEKFEAMITLGEDNSRMKDFFDVYIILKMGTINHSTLAEAIRQTFKNRNTRCSITPTVLSPDFPTSGHRLLQWTGFLRKIQYNHPLEFQDVHTYICQQLRALLPTL